MCKLIALHTADNPHMTRSDLLGGTFLEVLSSLPSKKVATEKTGGQDTDPCVCLISDLLDWSDQCRVHRPQEAFRAGSPPIIRLDWPVDQLQHTCNCLHKQGHSATNQTGLGATGLHLSIPAGGRPLWA